MKKEIIKAAAVSLAAVCCLAMAGCTAKKETSSNVKKIGIIQLVEHVALDASYKGFVDALKDAGYEDGKNIKLDFQNAQGEQVNCQTIAQKLINDRDDLILAIATPAAQAVANLTTTIPILVTAVTDPASAKLVKSNENPQTNVSGTSDLTPVAAQMDLLKQLVPSVQTIAFLYSSNEQNSIFQVNLAKAACDKLGIKYIDATVSNSNEIQQVTQSLVGKVQAVYSPTDNMIAAGIPTVAAVLNPAKIPFICGEEGMVNAGGLATYGINYYELGRLTGEMAAEIFRDGKKVSEMPIRYLEKLDVTVNMKTAAEIGITIPEDILAKAAKK